MKRKNMARVGVLLLFLMSLMVTRGRAAEMSLNDAVDTAIKQNPTVAESSRKINASAAKYEQAVGTFLPSLSISGNYGDSYTQPSTVQVVIPSPSGETTQNFTMGSNRTQVGKGYQGNINQAIYVPALFPSLRIAKKGLEISLEEYRKIVIDTTYNATQAFFSVIMAEKSKELAEESEQMAKMHYDQVQAMLNAGTSTKADLLRSAVEVANYKVSIIQAQNSIDISKDNFNNVLGRDLLLPVDLKNEGFNGTVESIVGYDELLKLAFKNRPEWLQFLWLMGIGEDSIDLARTGALPNVTVSGQAGKRATNDSVISTDVNSWAVTGAVAWTLFDGFGTWNRVKEAAENYEAQKDKEVQLRNNITLEVRNAYLNLIAALEVVKANQAAVDSAQESFQVYTSRYKAGVATNIDVIDAQVALTQALYNQLKALFAVETSKAKLNQVTGSKLY